MLGLADRNKLILLFKLFKALCKTFVSSDVERLLILIFLKIAFRINILLDSLFEPDILILFEDFTIDPSTLTSLILAFYLRGVLFYLFLIFFLIFLQKIFLNQFRFD